MMDEMMIHEDDARKPAAFPFTLAGKMAREMRDWSGTPGSWVHVGDDVVNDCEAAKTHGPFKTVLVAHPGVVPWGQPRVDPARAVTAASGVDEVGSSELVDVRVTSVGEIPGAIAGLYAS
jgi:putative hydrolase of the HAD superfamily